MRGMLVVSSFPSASFGSLGQDSFVFGDPPVAYTISALRIWGGTQSGLLFGISPDPGEDGFDGLTLELLDETIPIENRTMTQFVAFDGVRNFEWNVPWLDDNLTILNDARYQTHLSTGATVSVCLRTSTQTCPDSTAPVYLSGTASAASLVLTYHETLDSGSDPDPSAFSVMVNENAGVAPSSVDVTGATVVLTLADAIGVQDGVQFSYTKPSSDATQDAAGNEAASLPLDYVGNSTPNSPATFDSGLAATISVSEDTAPGTEIGSPYTATDPDGEGLHYTLSGTDASSFTLHQDTGQLSTRVALDFDSNSSYSVTIQVTDGKTATNAPDGGLVDATFDVTINVTDVDEDGTVSLPGTITGGQAVTATLTDPDGTTSNESWQWSRSDTQGGTFTAISGAISNPYTPVAGDVGKYLKATVSYTDPHGSGKSATSDCVRSQVAVGNRHPSFSIQRDRHAQRSDENSAIGLKTSARPGG